MTTVAVKRERTDRALAVIITLIIHAAILLFLLLYIIITPLPPYPPVANTPELELDLYAGGGGSSSGASAASSVATTHETVKTPSSNTPTVTNDVEASTPIPSGKAKVIPKKIDTVAKQPQISLAQANLENKFKHAVASGGSGSGASNGQGGMGNGNGSGGSGGGLGGGNGPSVGAGKGFGYDLTGRQLEVRPQLVTNNPEQGQIVVGITVDGDGNVTEATPGMVGSTITDASLYVLVKNAALKIKFNKSPTDSPEQMGTVTFRFTIQ